MNTRTKGDIGLLQVATAFTERGHAILLPITDNLRYDLIVDIAGALKKVQVKSVPLKNRTLHVLWESTNYLKGKWVRKKYENIDWLAVYCPELSQVYLLDPGKFPKHKTLNLRFGATKNHQKAKTWEGADYHIDKILPQ